MDKVRTFEFGADHVRDARVLRDAFGCFTTGVTVVTTFDGEGRPVGFTANSFASVSLDPPLALVCVDNGAASLPALETAGAFTVNVLHADQEDMARRFARRGGDRFAHTSYETWLTGAPVLDGCMANFEMRTHHAFQAGDHKVFVGQIVKARMDPAHRPLVFFRGGYCGVRLD